MKARKGLVLMLALVMVVSLFTGCAGKAAEEPVKDTAAESATEETVAEEAPLRIAFITKVMNPYFKVMVEGAQKAADENGVELLHAAAQEQTAVEQQIAIVQDMIAKQVDAICIAPIGSKELVPVLAEAVKAGIPVINVDNKLDDEAMAEAGIDPITYVGVDDEVSAYNAAKAIVDALGGEGKVAILEGIQSADNAQKRKAGAEKAFNEAPGIEIVASQTANWAAEEALDVFTNMLQANPDINGLFCANDMMSFGALQAIDAAGKTGDIIVSSIDAEDQAIQNVKDGLALATVYQNQDAQAAKAIELALELIKGNEIPVDVRVETILMTKDDIN